MTNDKAELATNRGVLDNIGDVTLKGRLGETLDSMIAHHVAAMDADYITAPFMEKTETKQWWQTEFWGKWMHSAVPYLRYHENATLRASIERGIDRIIASQEECGYIGNYPDELRCCEGWDVWGMKYTMLGLLHYHDLARAEGRDSRADEALAACRRLCDYVIAEIGPNGRRGVELWQTGNWTGYASSSILEPVVWLYRRTGDKCYLDFALFIADGMEKPESGPRLIDLALRGISVADRNGHGNTPEKDGGYVGKNNRWKAYEMMSCYQGLVELWEETGRRELLDAAIAAAKDIACEEVNLAGGCASSEAWFHGAHKQHIPYVHLQETCVTTTWMRLCEKLLVVTGDPMWADCIERTFYNAYLGALKPDGSEFAGYTPLSGSRFHGQHHCFMHIDCCNANGPRGFLCFLKKLFRADGEGVVFDFYASALVKAALPDGRMAAFDMYSLYPRSGFVRIVSHFEGRLATRFRVPGWCRKATFRLNGKELPGSGDAAGYFTIERDWRLGDIVEMDFAMPVVAHVAKGHVAFTRGPVLLARDSRFADGDMMEPFRMWTLQDGQEVASFAEVRAPSDDIWMAWSAALPIGQHHANPEGRLESTVFFCDYASAGNEWRRGNFYRTWFPFEHGPWEDL
ncbi:MAG: glycoside hydrolase family 127 protein [Kiritimatiellae bacterium]|nr:glycoside hydrolase family 127 protein [Kiritimatiellia bacterium]